MWKNQLKKLVPNEIYTGSVNKFIKKENFVWIFWSISLPLPSRKKLSHGKSMSGYWKKADRRK